MVTTPGGIAALVAGTARAGALSDHRVRRRRGAATTRKLNETGWTSRISRNYPSRALCYRATAEFSGIFNAQSRCFLTSAQWFSFICLQQAAVKSATGGEGSGLSTSVIISATVNRRAYTQGEIENFISSEVVYLQVIIAEADRKTGPLKHVGKSFKLPGTQWPYCEITMSRGAPWPKRTFSYKLIHRPYECKYIFFLKFPAFFSSYRCRRMSKQQVAN